MGEPQIVKRDGRWWVTSPTTGKEWPAPDEKAARVLAHGLAQKAREKARAR